MSLRISDLRIWFVSRHPEDDRVEASSDCVRFENVQGEYFTVGQKRLEFRTTVCPSRRPEHCYVQSEIVNLQPARPAGLYRPGFHQPFP
jgi:hypothetical protein